MNAMDDQTITLIHEARPEIPPSDPAVKARALARLRDQFEAPPQRRFHLRLPVAGVVAAGVAAAILVPQLGVAGRPTKAQALERAARTVERQAAAPRPGPHQWVYTRKMHRYALQEGNVVGEKAMLRGKVIGQEWWRFDGRVMARSVQNGKVYLKGIVPPGQRLPQRRRGDLGFDGYIGGPAVWNSTPHRLYDYVAGLPADPVALLARIRRDYSDSGQDVTTFGVIARLFRNNPLIPPGANAALYRALAKMPGVRVVEDATDYAGRHGIGIVFDTHTRRDGRVVQQLVLDPKTYRYMGDRNEATLDWAVVDKPGQRP